MTTTGSTTPRPEDARTLTEEVNTATPWNLLASRRASSAKNGLWAAV
jgi:hypothetical protein